MALPPSPSVPPGDVTVLVVDDDPDLLLLCATHLRLAGYAVLMASGSVEAQATCDIYPTRIDLILVDVLLYPQAVDVDHDRNVTLGCMATNSFPSFASNDRSAGSC
jgi:CheY-like chemotaxis protein